MKHIVIIGNGISGITTARHVRKRDSEAKITVISGETDYFYSRTALMYIYMGHMKFEHTQPYEPYFWQKNRINLMRKWVKTIDTAGKALLFSDNTSLAYDQLVLAVGSKPNKFGWPGQDLPGVQGLYSYQDLEALEDNTTNHKVERAVIVGGGLIGVELAEMLLTRNIPVTFLVREGRFWGNVLPKEEGELISRHMLKHHVDLRFNTELDEIIAGPDGRASAIRTKDGEEIKCQLVGLTAGVSPNIEFIKDSTIDTQRGIMVNRFLETNVPDVFALGDCAQFDEPPAGRRPIEQVWYTGRMQGETLARTLTGDRTEYKPGYWFNSAKFFDIEYQTYGTVLSNLREGEKQFYWEHANGEICIKIVFDAESHQFIGINNFGIRLRHHAFDRWLRDGATVEHVLEHLRDANFDPEFYKKYEEEIVNKFNAENGTSVSVKARSWKRILGFAKA